MNSIFWGQALQGRLHNRNHFWAENERKAEPYSHVLALRLEAGELPFINMPYREDLETRMEQLAESIKGRFKHMLLLGIGGSSLGARSVCGAFRPEQFWPGYEGPFLWVADNVDGEELAAWLARLNPEETLVTVISKSGGTIETMVQYFVVREWLKKSLAGRWNEHVIAITDAYHGSLRQEVNAHKLVSLPVPDHLGGRFSVLSAVGLVPAAFMGVDWKALLAGAAKLAEPLVQDTQNLGQHPAWKLACWAKAVMDAGYDELIFFNYFPAWKGLGAWFAQLWAESLGKSGRGSMPLPAVGVTDQHSLLQMFLDGAKNKACLFVQQQECKAGAMPELPMGDSFSKKWDFLRGHNFHDLLPAEALGTRGAFAAQHIPLVRLAFEGTEESYGACIALLEMATFFTGRLLELDPLDQPAVEYGKRLALARLGATGYDKEEAALASLLDSPDEEQLF